jgi:DUF1680 family protein
MIELKKDGRFYERFHGNIKYLKFLYKHYGQEMIDAYKARNYSPGKLLERMWDGEYAGKWLDAAIRSGVNTGDNELLVMVDSMIKSLLKHQQPDGYMGIKPPTDRKLNIWENTWDLWNQWNSMIGFLTNYEYRGHKASLEAAAKIADWIVSEFTPIKKYREKLFEENITDGFTNAVLIGQFTRLYRFKQDEKYLDFVKQVIDEFPPIAQMLSSGEPYLFHPYMLNAVLMGVAEYASITKDLMMLEKIEEAWSGLARIHMFPTGSLGERENLDDKPIKDVPDGQLQETCATTEWIFLTMTLYEITGNIKYIEALEKTIYNALIGAQSDDGMKWCYWMPLRYSKHFLHGPTRCCFWSGPRGIARIPQIIYGIRENNIYINLFESSNAELELRDGKALITQKNDFPDEGKCSINVKPYSNWEGEVNIRIPEWTKNLELRINENLIDKEKNNEGYIKIDMKGSDEYRIEVNFGLPIRLEELAGNYVICRGPEVLALDTRDNIDTWLGAQDDLITLPDGINFQPLDQNKRYQWPGPVNSKRRRYLVKVNDARTDELREVILTPYADAGNEGAAFRTAFPKNSIGDYPSDWKED